MAMIRNEVRALQQQLRRAKKPPALSASVYEVGLMILWCTNCCEVMLRTYLEGEVFKLKHPRLCATGASRPVDTCRVVDSDVLAQWHSFICDRYKTWSIDDEINVLFGHWPPAHRLQKAEELTRSLKVKAWVATQNAKGYAPSGPAIWRQYKILSREGRGETLYAWRHKNRMQRKSAGNWVQKWKCRHGVTRGHFKTGPALNLEEARSKATGEKFSLASGVKLKQVLGGLNRK